MSKENQETLSKEFWNDRCENQETGWDIGYASPAIVNYFEKIKDQNAKILIPGCGNAYEAEAIYNLGFRNIHLLDIAPLAVENLKEKFSFAKDMVITCEDFFEHENQYDYIVEQTIFCALSPNLRKMYVEKSASLLLPNGKIVGLLFNTEFEKQGPPFGGEITEYKVLFEPQFDIEKMESCYNSITPRNGKELFIQLKKRST